MSNTLNGEIPEEIWAKIEVAAKKEAAEWISLDKNPEEWERRYDLVYAWSEFGYRLALDQIAALRQENERLKEALFTAQLEISKGTSEIALLNGELSTLKEQGDGWISVGEVKSLLKKQRENCYNKALLLQDQGPSPDWQTILNAPEPALPQPPKS